MKHVPGTKYLITHNGRYGDDYVDETSFTDELEGVSDWLEALDDWRRGESIKVRALNDADGTLRDVTEDVFDWMVENWDFSEGSDPHWLDFSNRHDRDELWKRDGYKDPDAYDEWAA